MNDHIRSCDVDGIILPDPENVALGNLRNIEASGSILPAYGDQSIL